LRGSPRRTRGALGTTARAVVDVVPRTFVPWRSHQARPSVSLGNYPSNPRPHPVWLEGCTRRRQPFIGGGTGALDDFHHSADPLVARAGVGLHAGWVHPHPAADRARRDHHPRDPGKKARLTRQPLPGGEDAAGHGLPSGSIASGRGWLSTRINSGVLARGRCTARRRAAGRGSRPRSRAPFTAAPLAADHASEPPDEKRGTRSSRK